MSLKQAKQTLLETLASLRAKFQGYRRQTPRLATMHVSNQFHNGLLPPKHGTLQPWAWSSFFSKKTGQPTAAPQTSPPQEHL
ncbi:hypothetical protein I79_021776 [Cricetulus griseus]|uniref:Uncharacterized protein n=1 Tax=Cricetulus griseus TaxID=10029 RepID=G3IDJ3_CRIGR|nr:hypothetical protein I79_021776 [Cricetulus griseus]